MKSANFEEFKLLLDDDEYDFRYDLGIGDLASTIKEHHKERIIESICKHYAVLMIKAELDQMLCGLDSTLNCLQLIRDHPVHFRPHFIYSNKRLSADDLLQLFPPQFSLEGSNHREEEERIFMYWADFMYHIEGMLTLSGGTGA